MNEAGGILDQFGVREVIRSEVQKLVADIAVSAADRPFAMQSVTIDLSTAATENSPYRLGFPFRSVFVREASDSSTYVKMSLHSDELYQIQNGIKLKINDAFELPRTVSKAYLTWEAQSGKSITIYFFLDGLFRSGAQLSLNAGGVSISDGSAFTTTLFSITAATATALFASNSSRKMGTWVNETGADAWVGGSSVSNSGSNKGVLVPSGGIVEWRNSAALYVYSVSGASNQVKMEQT